MKKHIYFLLLSTLIFIAPSSRAQQTPFEPAFQKGWRQINAYQSDSALQLADSLLQVIDKSDNTGRIRAMNIKAKALFQQNKYKESLALLFDGLRMCKQPADNKQVAYIYGEIGYLYYAQKQFAQSKSYYYRQIDILRKLNGVDSLADPLINLATMHEALREYDSSLILLNQVGDIVSRNNNLRQHGYYYLNRGVLMQYLNKLDSAAYYYTAAYNAWNAIGFESQLYKATFNLGYIADQQNNHRKAIEYYKRTEQSVRKFGLQREIAHVYGTMAEAYAAMGQYDSGYKYLLQYVVINDSVTQSDFNTNLARLDKQFQAEKSQQTIKEQQSKLDRQHNRILLAVAALLIVILASVVILGYLSFGRRVQKQVDEAKSRFFANVAHEIRTPLSMIQGPVKLLKDKVTDPDMLYQLDMADRNTARLNELMNQMLAIAKIDSAKYTLNESLGNPADFITAIANSFRDQAAEKGLSMTINMPEEPGNVLFDKDALEKITANLVSNAIKYTPAGGGIGVDLSVDDNEWVLTVWDTGTGIAPEEQEHIFDRFYRTEQHKKDGSKGTGIGLALVKELVQLMAGTITVESDAGKGAAFTARLPLKRPQATSDVSPEDGAPTILLVEDDADILDFNKKFLQGSGYHVLTATNGGEALQLLQQELPDLVVTDMMMPGMDGLALLKELKGNVATDHIPVIILSAKTATRTEGLDQGAQVYLQKPFVPAELVAVVKNQLQLLQKQKGRLQAAEPAEVATKTLEQRFAEADPFSRQCYEFIKQHLDDSQLSVEMLANELHINRSHFQRKIKALTGFSPSELIKTVRMEKALELLQRKEGNITEIAYATGFTSQSYFTKCFSDHFGYPPSQVV
jgi:two-component system sensor histidine kinase ChiS